MNFFIKVKCHSKDAFPVFIVLFCILAILLATVPLTQPALAATKSSITAAQAQEARSLILEATRLQLAGDVAGAIAKYRASLQIQPNPKVEAQLQALLAKYPEEAGSEENRSVLPGEEEGNVPPEENRSFRRQAPSSNLRHALVIGNAAYSASPLRNPANDAQDMAQALRAVGFSVDLLLNAEQRQMEEAIRSLGSKLRSGGAGLFYFAGHGVQVDGVNYLIPLNAKIESEADVRYEAVDANRVLSQMQAAGNEVNLVFLDACRNNPYARSFRSSQPGLAPMDSPRGSLVAFATAPGSVAADGTGRNGVYTKHLLKAITTPDTEIGILMREVRKNVLTETRGKQVTFDVSSLVEEFYFVGGRQGQTTPPPEPPADERLVRDLDQALGAYEQFTGAGGRELQRLAEAGNSFAMLLLGRKYKLGYVPFPKNQQLASFWLERGIVAEPELLQFAQANNTQAMTVLAMLYATAEDPEKDRAAVSWYRKAADQGNRVAQNNLGAMYFEGRGVSQDDKEAVSWYRKAGEQGYAAAQNNLGLMFAKGRGVSQDDKEAVSWLRKAADQGYALAQIALGAMYFEGRGVRQDDKEAVSWCRKAAEQGETLAQAALGAMYFDGRGVGQDDKEAVSWIRKAAEQGETLAQAALGEMYRDGRGVGQDDKEAVSWLRKAAEQDNATAQAVLGEMFFYGRGVAQDDKEAVSWLRKAAEQGDATAQYNLGWMYQEGRGVSQDDKEAFSWYRKAAEQGDEDAQFHLGWMYQEGRGVSKDDKEAVSWFRKAAEQGETLAQAALGAMYFGGCGVSQDDKQAVSWYRKAAEQGLALAQNQLGEMYFDGRGVSKDRKEAVSWYRKAAAQGNEEAKKALARLGEE